MYSEVCGLALTPQPSGYAATRFGVWMRPGPGRLTVDFPTQTTAVYIPGWRNHLWR